MTILSFPAPVRQTPQPVSDHWLMFDAARQVTGCHCGFEADMDSDCGYGDSVVDHLLSVGNDT